MALVIAITGTPGTGKSTFAKTLSDKLKGSKLVEINDIVESKKLFSKVEKDGTKVVKLNELSKEISDLSSEAKKESHVILVGHLAPDLKISPDIVVVTRLELKELARRLEARGYGKEKIRENIISESVDYCGVRSREMCGETYEVETDSQKSEMISYITALASGKKGNPPEKREISMLSSLLDLIDEDNVYAL